MNTAVIFGLCLLIAVVAAERCHTVHDCHVTTCSAGGTLICELEECSCGSGGAGASCVHDNECHCQNGGQPHCVEGQCQCHN